MKIYIWQHSWAGNILDGTPVYEWSSNENDIPYVCCGEIRLKPSETQLDTVRFVQEHIVWDIPKSTFANFPIATDIDMADAVTEYAQKQGFYKHD